MTQIRGAILLNKPKGLTSHDVVHRIRKIFKTKEVGHAGTLDPMAQGLLVILLGEATKLSNYVTSEDKGYLASLELGYCTDTLDTEGEVISKTENFDLTREEIAGQAQALVGDLKLPVPIYSAVKLNGRKLYEYARSGDEVTVPVRTMRFYSSDVVDVTPKTLQVRLTCEKGAYIRAWVSKLGDNLSVGATMTDLVRETSGRFSLQQSIDLEALKQQAEEAPSHEEFLAHTQSQSYFWPVEKCVAGRFFRLDGFEERLMKNGQIAHSLAKRLVPCIHECMKTKKDQILRIFVVKEGKDQLLALIQIHHQYPKPKILRVFN